MRINKELTNPIEILYSGDWLARIKHDKPFRTIGQIDVRAEAISEIEFHYAFSKNVFYSYREDDEEE